MKRKTIFRAAALAPLPLSLGLRLIASRNPEATERLFSAGVYPRIAAPVSRLMGLCPVPVVEIGLLALLLFIIYSVCKRRFFRVIATLLLIPALFLGGWGLNYFRLPLERTLSLPVQASTVDELTLLCERLIDDANAYADTMPPSEPFPLVPDAINRAAQSWPIPTGRFAPPKRALSSPLLSSLMIEGIVSPFTLEALINGSIPALSLPFAACHEAAHIRGFAQEEDASLIGYLACMAADEPYFRYSGSVGALLHSLNALREANRNAYLRCRERMGDALRDDLAGHAAFWKPYQQTKTAEVSSQINDAYLQTASGGEQSARSYGRIVDLLLALQRKDGITQ